MVQGPHGAARGAAIDDFIQPGPPWCRRAPALAMAAARAFAR